MLIIKPNVIGSKAHEKADYLIELLRNRGIDVVVMEGFDSYQSRDWVKNAELNGEKWDSVLVLTVVKGFNPMTDTIEGERPNGIWSVQNADTIEPIFISMSTPFLLHTIPFANTYINCYSTEKRICEMLVKCLFGEIETNSKSPVKTGGW